jgi:hypothetical protein
MFVDSIIRDKVRDESVLSETVLINVFDMLIDRLDTMNDNISKMSIYLINEARFKTNNTISGGIFNYPFEIHNYKFDKKNYAFVTIKLNNNLNHKTLYDIVWCILTNEKLDDYNELKVQNSIINFIKSFFGINLYNKMIEGVKLYIDEEKEEYLTCKNYKLDTIYEYLPEFIINEFITKNEKIQYFKSFNHVSYAINISFIDQTKTLYIDELIDSILLNLKAYGYSASDINSIKIVGIDYFINNLISFYDMNEINYDVVKPKVIDYIKQLCPYSREKIRTILIKYDRDCQLLPIFKNIENIKFLIDTLEQDEFNIPIEI